MKKIGLVLILVLVLSSLFIAPVSALAPYIVLKEVPFALVIKPNLQDLGVYLDEDMTVEVGIGIGIIDPEPKQGDVKTINLWLKNDGNVPLNFTVKSFPEVLDWGSITYNQSTFELLVGESEQLDFTLSIDWDAPVGNASFRLQFCSEVESKSDLVPQ